MLSFKEALQEDVIKDPPFSNLDLISCRNLLIYIVYAWNCFIKPSIPNIKRSFQK